MGGVALLAAGRHPRPRPPSPPQARLHSEADNLALTKPFLTHLARGVAAIRSSAPGRRATRRAGLALLASLGTYGLPVHAPGGSSGGGGGGGDARYASEEEAEDLVMLMGAGGGVSAGGGLGSLGDEYTFDDDAIMAEALRISEQQR